MPGLEAGAPGGAARPVTQGHPRTGVPHRYPAADDPQHDLPAGSRPARKNRSGQRCAGAFRRRGRADFGLKGAAALAAAAQTHRGPRGAAGGKDASPDFGDRGGSVDAVRPAGQEARLCFLCAGEGVRGRLEVGVHRRADGKRSAGQGSRGAGLSHSAVDRGLARWVQWFLTLQQFCSAIVKCLGPLDPAGPAATASTTPMGRPTRGPCSGQGHTRDSRRSPRIRSRAPRSTRTFPASPADHELGLTTLRCREVTWCGGADRWEPLGTAGCGRPGRPTLLAYCPSGDATAALLRPVGPTLLETLPNSQPGPVSGPRGVKARPLSLASWWLCGSRARN